MPRFGRPAARRLPTETLNLKRFRARRARAEGHVPSELHIRVNIDVSVKSLGDVQWGKAAFHHLPADNFVVVGWLAECGIRPTSGRCPAVTL